MIEAQARQVENPFGDGERFFIRVIRSLQSGETLKLSLAGVEAWLKEKGDELLRKLLQGHLDVRAEQEVRERAVIGSDEIERTHVRNSERAGWPAGQERRSALPAGHHPVCGPLFLPSSGQGMCTKCGQIVFTPTLHQYWAAAGGDHLQLEFEKTL